MTENLRSSLADVRLAPAGASDETIARAEADMDCRLPEDVKALLREHDGGAGTLGPHKRPFELWSIERIADECEAQEVTRAVPGLVLFGSDGGSEGYGWFPQAPRETYGRISLIAAGPHEFEGLGDSLAELLSALASS
jgi:SMI1 / KNR4 family (SUKH-1)